MEEKNEAVAVDPIEDEELETDPDLETTDWEVRAKKLEEQAIAQRERTRAMKVELNKLKKAQETKAEPKTGELSDEQLNFLDIKGISDEEEVKIVHEVISRTGKPIRDVIKDDYVQTKLATLRAKKAVESAIPSGTKRSGNQTNDVATALARFEQTGELPDDFELRSAVVNAKVEQGNTNKPSWHK